MTPVGLDSQLKRQFMHFGMHIMHNFLLSGYTFMHAHNSQMARATSYLYTGGAAADETTADINSGYGRRTDARAPEPQVAAPEQRHGILSYGSVTVVLLSPPWHSSARLRVRQERIEFYDYPPSSPLNRKYLISLECRTKTPNSEERWRYSGFSEPGVPFASAQRGWHVACRFAILLTYLLRSCN